MSTTTFKLTNLTHMTPITYGEKIEELIAAINAIYNECEYIRDIATEEEKKYWNETRKIFYDADAPLQKLLDIVGKRYDMEI